MVRVRSTWLECNEFRFVRVKAEAVMQKPVHDDEKSIGTFLDDRRVGGASGDNSTVIDI